jgi:asparagine synthase (glutamine-hydrolysing)
MVKFLARGDTLTTGQFGVFCPYWSLQEGRVVLGDTAQEIISALPPKQRVIDPVAFLELLSFNYMLGNRTLVQGVNRMPWRATLRADGRIERRPPIPHGNAEVAPEQAARELRARLERELLEATEGRERILLQLTGGLDSRVVAGILKKLEPQISGAIVCTTWGQRSSRDVAYAERIAHWYDWEFIHIPYEVELTWANIQRGAIWGGSEVAGFHLHGREWFRHCAPQDLVIAASFGDMVGRAEFSSIHLSRLTLESISNPWDLVSPSLADECIKAAMLDRATAWEGEADDTLHVRCELDQQENYVRRMLAHASDYIRQFCAVHQAFTSEDVVSYMWGLAAQCRTDAIYHCLLKGLDAKLFSLPWARNGVAPDGTLERDQSLAKDYHDCKNWARGELRPKLEELFFSEGLPSLGLVNSAARGKVWEDFVATGEIYELVVKVASVQLSRRHFQLSAGRSETSFRPATWDRVLQAGRGLRRYLPF